MNPDEKFEIFISVCAAFFHHKFQEIFFRDPMHLHARARAHGPRDRASFSGMLSTRAPFQSVCSRRRQPAEIRRRDRRMAPRGAVLRPRRFPPERCRGCSASWDLVAFRSSDYAGWFHAHGRVVLIRLFNVRRERWLCDGPESILIIAIMPLSRDRARARAHPSDRATQSGTRDAGLTRARASDVHSW